MIIEAVDEITGTQASAFRRRQIRARVTVPLYLTDALLGELEELNLAGRRRVPADWEARLAGLVAMVPPEIHEVPELRSRVATTRLMEALFELQDSLLDIKVGRVRQQLKLEEEGDDPFAFCA